MHETRPQVFSFAGLVLLSVCIVAPMSLALSGSFKPMSELYASPLGLIPKQLTLEAWVRLFERVPVVQWLGNALYVSLLAVVISILLCAPAAYGFARLRFRGRDFCYRVVLATLMLPLGSYIVPLYMVYRELGLLDTLFGIALPIQEGVLGVFLLRQFFLAVPKELEEAAFIDGCTRWQAFRRIVLPIARPSLVTLGIFAFVWKWNMFLWPLIVLNSSDKYIIGLGIPLRLGSYVADRNIMLAGAIVMAVPVLLLYAIFQRQIIETQATSGLKA